MHLPYISWRVSQMTGSHGASRLAAQKSSREPVTSTSHFVQVGARWVPSWTCHEAVDTHRLQPGMQQLAVRRNSHLSPSGFESHSGCRAGCCLDALVHLRGASATSPAARPRTALAPTARFSGGSARWGSCQRRSGQNGRIQHERIASLPYCQLHQHGRACRPRLGVLRAKQNGTRPWSLAWSHGFLSSRHNMGLCMRQPAESAVPHLSSDNGSAVVEHRA